MITVKKQKEKSTITFKDEAGIENAAEFKETMLKAIKDSDKIYLNFSKSTTLHLSIIQIILSAKNEIEKLQKKLFVQDENDVLKKSVNELGISANNVFPQ